MFLMGVIGLWAGLWARVIILDDALITFRVAENLAYGHGFVYNPGERVQVTTTPLYTMVLAVGVWLFGSAPQAALVLNISLSTLIPILAYDLGRRLTGRITGLGGALLLSLSPFLVMAFSMESYLYAALILASMDAYVAGRYGWAGLLAGITALVRGDAILLGACMLTYDFLRQGRLSWPERLRGSLIMPALIIPAGWYLFATLYYGSPFPATLQAKSAQGAFNWLGVRFLDGFWSYWDEWTRIQDYDTFYLFPLLMVIALLPIVRGERLWLIIMARDGLYVAIFMILAVPAAQWYYAPLMPGIALLTARGAQFMTEGLGRLIQARFKGLTPVSKVGILPLSPSIEAAKQGGLLTFMMAVVLILILLRAVYPATQAIVAQNPDWKAQVYPEVGRWIAENTNASANLATIDIGHLGYWSDRHIVDIVGLAQPDVAPHIAEGDFGYAIRHYQPDLVLIGYSWLPEVQTSAWFQTIYTPRYAFNFKALNEPVLLFSQRQGVKVQPDMIPASEIRPLNVDFNRQISLTGYSLNEPLRPGAPLAVTLFWQVEAPIEVDFTVFVQLVDAENHIKAQQDSKPQQGFYGANYWQPGEQVIDTHIFPIPIDIPPGSYDILLGFYEAETGMRLQILDEAGAFKSDHVRLQDIRVIESNP